MKKTHYLPELNVLLKQYKLKDGNIYWKGKIPEKEGDWIFDENGQKFVITNVTEDSFEIKSVGK